MTASELDAVPGWAVPADGAAKHFGSCASCARRPRRDRRVLGWVPDAAAVGRRAARRKQATQAATGTEGTVVSTSPGAPEPYAGHRGRAGQACPGGEDSARSWEDLGWFVVDNLPPELISTMVELGAKAGANHRSAW